MRKQLPHEPIEQSMSATKPWTEKDTLEELYVNRGLEQSAIADKLGCSPATISRWLGDFEIETKNSDDYSDTPWRDESALKEHYHGKSMSIPQIAEKWGGASQHTIHRWLKKHGIQRRRPGTSSDCEPWHDKSTLEELYVGREMSILEIADKFGVEDSNILYWLRKHAIDTRDAVPPSGEDHPLWKEGNRSVYYGPGWHRARKEVLKRDGYECRVCGMTDEEHTDEYGKGLDVHHIVKRRKFESPADANNPDNLAAVCRSCHLKYEDMPVFPTVD